MAKFKHPTPPLRDALDHVSLDTMDTMPVVSGNVPPLMHSADHSILAAIIAGGIIFREKGDPQVVAKKAVDYAVALHQELVNRGLR